MPGIDLPFAIGGSNWPGLSKLIEECGEVLQVAGKLIATGGQPEHWDGSDLRERVVDELGDLLAALSFVRKHALTDVEDVHVAIRSQAKYRLFLQWHEEQRTTVAAPTL